MNDPNGEFQRTGREFLQKAKIQKFRIPIRAHVLRKSDGSGGISQTDIEASIARTNAYYRSLNMEFYVDKYHYLDNTTDYETYLDYDKPRPMETRLAKDHSVQEAINVFFVQRSSTSWGPKLKDKGHIVMNNGHTRNESTFAHELGHFFGLPHTHAGGNELVDGSNCSSAGDGFCDTPADPNLSGKVSDLCRYTGTVKDANDDTYRPMTNNIMSYTRFKCRGFFTKDQRERILLTYGYRQSTQSYDLHFKNKTPVIFYDQGTGMGQIWHFSGGQLQERTYHAGWLKNWRSMVTFELANRSYILLYDKTNGGIRIYDLTVRGKLGSLTYSQSGVSKGWDIVQSFEHGDIGYVMFYDKDTGKAEIHRVLSGRLWKVTYSGTWSTGWDIVQTFQQGRNPYAIFYDRQTGKGRIYSMYGGKLSTLTYASTSWYNSWDIIETFEEGDIPYAVFYDKANGNSRIYHLTSGRLGTSTPAGPLLNKWDTIIAYHAHSHPYLSFYH